MTSFLQPRNVLISSAGRRVALMRSFAEAFDQLGLEGDVLAADAQRASAAFQLASRACLVPRCDDPTFADVMFELCERWNVALVVPTIDTELDVWASMRGRLAEIGTTVAVSSPEAIEIAADKVKTNAWLRCHGLPATSQLTRQDVLEGGEDVFPLIAKDRRGSCSAGLLRLRDTLDLEHVGVNDVIERVAPGVEYTIDVLMDHRGRTRCAVPRRRMEVRGGEVSKSIVELRPELVCLATRVCDALPGARGVLNVQVMWDRASGQFTVIEINARYGGGFPLTCAAGGNYPRWMLEELFDLPSSLNEAKWRDGLTMLRYDDAVFVDRAEADWA